MRAKSKPQPILEALLGKKETYWGTDVYWRFPLEVYPYVIRVEPRTKKKHIIRAIDPGQTKAINPSYIFELYWK